MIALRASCERNEVLMQPTPIFFWGGKKRWSGRLQRDDAAKKEEEGATAEKRLLFSKVSVQNKFVFDLSKF
jgi:hypothetical protein